MNRSLSTGPLFLVLLSPVLFAQDTGRTYNLKLNCRPIRGYKTEMTDTASMKMRMVIRAGDKVLSRVDKAEEHAFTAVETIVKVDGGKVTEARWTFSKAIRTSGGEPVACGFQGKTILVKTSGNEREFTYEDATKIEGEDLDAIKQAFLQGGKEKGPTGDELFAPKKPVRIGESWNIPMKAMIEGTFDKDMAEGTDMEKSKGAFTLKSVRQAAGAEFGTIEGAVEIVLGQMGSLKLDQPFSMKMTTQLDCCVNCKVPDGELQAKIELKGTSPADGPNGVKVMLDVEMAVQNTLSKRTAK